MVKEIDPKNQSLKTAIDTFLQQGVHMPGPDDGISVFQFLNRVRNEFLRAQNAMPTDWDNSNIHRVESQLDEIMQMGLRVSAYVNDDKNLAAMVGDLTGHFNLTAAIIPSTLKGARELLPTLPNFAVPSSVREVEIRREQMVAGLADVEKLYDQTIGQAARNKQSGKGRDEERPGRP